MDETSSDTTFRKSIKNCNVGSTPLTHPNKYDTTIATEASSTKINDI
jgi:hypothetical protein